MALLTSENSDSTTTDPLISGCQASWPDYSQMTPATILINGDADIMSASVADSICRDLVDLLKPIYKDSEGDWSPEGKFGYRARVLAYVLSQLKDKEKNVDDVATAKIYQICAQIQSCGGPKAYVMTDIMADVTPPKDAAESVRSKLETLKLTNGGEHVWTMATWFEYQVTNVAGIRYVGKRKRIHLELRKRMKGEAGEEEKAKVEAEIREAGGYGALLTKLSGVSYA